MFVSTPMTFIVLLVIALAGAVGAALILRAWRGGHTCPQCGARQRAAAKFCRKCGAAIKAETPKR